MIALQHIQVTFQQKNVLNDLSLTLKPGLHYGLLGPNGAGKSTFLHVLSRDIRPNKGEVNWFGCPLSQCKNSTLAKQRALLPQKTEMGLPFSGREIVEMGRYPHFDYLPSATDKAIVRFVEELIELTPLLDKPYQALSGGEQQRLLLGKALAQLLEEPSLNHLSGKVLLLDEPTNNLDIYHQIQGFNLLETCQKKGLTIVTIFHDLNLASRYCQQLILLKDGHLEAYGKPSDVLTAEQIFNTFRVHAEVDTTGLYPHVFVPTLHFNHQWKQSLQHSNPVLKP